MRVGFRDDHISAADPAARALSPAVARYDAGLSCVLPCLNEAENLAVLLPMLRERLQALCTRWEILVVDDGSTDGTPALMERWATVPGVRYVQLSRNFGKEAALSAGLDAARGEAVVLMDADGQHAPDLIPEMIERWQAGADMVYAVRTDRMQEPRFKRLGARWFYRALGAGTVAVPPDAGDFRLLDRRVVQAILAMPERTRFMKGLYAWVGFKSVAIAYTPGTRLHGRSRFGAWRLARLAASGLTAFTTWPLRLVSLLGCAFAVLALGYAAYVVVDYVMNGNRVSGWTTIVTALLFFAGVNLVSLGVVGEYVGRIFEEVKGRPLYIVGRRLGRGPFQEPGSTGP